MRAEQIFIIGTLLALPASAAGVDQIDTLNWGVRAAGVMPNYNDAEFATGLGVSLIYRHREYSQLALEADLVTTVIDGELGRFDFSTSTAGAYLAWRSSGDLFLKLRGGVLAERVEVGPSDAWGAGLSGSVGIGWRRAGNLLELELTGIEKSAYMVSLAWYF